MTKGLGQILCNDHECGTTEDNGLREGRGSGSSVFAISGLNFPWVARLKDGYTLLQPFSVDWITSGSGRKIRGTSIIHAHAQSSPVTH